MASSPPIAIELRLGAAATPHRVAEAARLLDEMIHAANPDLPEDSVTMEVRNFETKAGLKARSPEARRALRSISGFLKKPSAPTEKAPERGAIARVLEQHGQMLLDYGATFFQKEQPIAHIDPTFLQSVRRIASAVPLEAPIVMRGELVAISPVLRAGRSAEGKDITARIRIKGTWAEASVPPNLTHTIFEFAEGGALASLVVSVVWRGHSSGDQVLDTKQIKIVSCKPHKKGISGKELLELLGTLPKGTFDKDFLS